MSRAVVSAAVAAAGVLAVAASGAVAAGPAESAFIPPDYRVEKRIATDFAGDARIDRVLVLVQRGGATDGTTVPTLQRRLVLLKARSDGGYVLIGEGRRALLCTSCGGALYAAVRTPVTVYVRRRVVIVEQQHGSSVVTFQRLRFRAEGALRTRLIGEDIRNMDRRTGGVAETSTNLLTGDRIVTRTTPGGRRTERRSRVPVRVVYVEDARRA